MIRSSKPASRSAVSYRPDEFNEVLSGQPLKRVVGHTWPKMSPAAATAAAFTASAGNPFPSRFLFGLSVAHCDAGAALSEDDLSNIRSVSGKIYENDALQYSTKQYKLELKPLFSGFELGPFAVTLLRSFLTFYSLLLEFRANMEDDDFLQDNQERHADVIVPLKESVKQIIRETTVMTTRRILERIAVHYLSQRMAWKLAKDLRKSVIRKAGRGMRTTTFFYCASRTTFRGHLLGAAASWLVQVGIEIYGAFSSLFNNNVDRADQLRLLGLKVSAITVRCGVSLVRVSVVAGIGATLFRPSTGQWIGKNIYITCKC
ncbi:Isopentenyl-diphosphate delta-isomerase [Quillaja saponaria]|uniref:Isopentenyl-diphosphate delta-isomerase n=1 Tax=Quillaja saponaria TaxID=32244 RepID=A0AAD7PBI4_QUISA|nr:Isopentenyl-diphosphate delta-isomerase [Quillaja saponaria]